MSRLTGIAAMLVGLLPGVAQPAPFAYLPDGDRSVTVIDVATHQVVHRLEHAMAVSAMGVSARPGSNDVYFAAHEIVRMDAATFALRPAIPTFVAHLVAASPRGNQVVAARDHCVFIGFLCPGGPPRGVGFFDPASGQETAFIPISEYFSSLAYDVSGDRIFVGDGFGLSIINAATHQVELRYPMPSRASGVWPHPDGQTLYVAMMDTGALRRLDLRNGATLDIPLGDPAWRVVGHPDGRRVYVTGGSAISVVDTESNRVVAKIAFDPAGPGEIDITPDGGFLYVGHYGRPGLSVISTQSHATVATHPGIFVAALGRFIGGPMSGSDATPGRKTGLFWNPAESGWGIHLTQRRDNIFAAFFTYGSEGAARFYTASNCVLDGSTCTSALTQSHGPDVLAGNFDPRSVTRGSPGQMRLQFHDDNRARLTYDVNGVAREVDIERQVFAAGPAANTDYTDLWWDPGESGWGMGITHQGNMMFLTWFVYDAQRNPVWYVASRCDVFAEGNGCTGRLYRASGPLGPNRTDGTFDAARVGLQDVGSIRATFSASDEGAIDYVLHGVAGRKSIVRQLF